MILIGVLVTSQHSEINSSNQPDCSLFGGNVDLKQIMILTQVLVHVLYTTPLQHYRNFIFENDLVSFSFGRMVIGNM